MAPPPTHRLSHRARSRYAAAALAVAISLVTAAFAPAAGAARKPSKVLTLLVPAPSAGDLTFASYSVTVKKVPARHARVAIAAAAVPADITVTSALRPVKKNVSSVTVAVARRLGAGTTARSAAAGSVALHLKFPAPANFKVRTIFSSRNALANGYPLNLPARCAPDLSNPFVPLPSGLLGTPRIYINPYPGLAGVDFQQNVWNATCWRPLASGFYARLQNQAPLAIALNARRSGNDNVLSFRSNEPLMAAGVWVPPSDRIVNVASQPGVSFRVQNSTTHSWRDNTYAYASGPFQAGTDYTIAYESQTSDAGQRSQFAKIGLFPPNGTAVMASTGTVP